MREKPRLIRRLPSKTPAPHGRSRCELDAPDLPLIPRASLVLHHGGEIKFVFHAAPGWVIGTVVLWPVIHYIVLLRTAKFLELLMLRFHLRIGRIKI